MEVQAVQSVFSAFGLSASAGLNAYIPLLMIAVTARVRPDLLALRPPFDFLTSGWVIALLTVLLVIEVLADKVPLIDHLNDVLGLVVRPTAGAILFAATTGNVTHLDTQFALVLGLLVAGGTHSVKAATRPVVTATTHGIGNPIVSTVEDVAAFLTSLVAILAPILLAIAFLAFVALIALWLARRPRRAQQVPAAD